MLSRKQFINYIKFFDSLSLEEEILSYYSNDENINDISEIEHSSKDYSIENLENLEFYFCNKNILTDLNIQDLEFFIFVELSRKNDNTILGIAFSIKSEILRQINENKNLNLIEKFTTNFCISKKMLDKMSKLS